MIVQMQNKRIDLCIKRCKNFKKDVFSTFYICYLIKCQFMLMSYELSKNRPMPT